MNGRIFLAGMAMVCMTMPAFAQSSGIGTAETAPNLSPNAGGPVGSTAVPRPAPTAGTGSAETSPNVSPNAGGPVGSTTVPRGNNPSTLDVGKNGNCAPGEGSASQQAAGGSGSASPEAGGRSDC